MPIFFDHTITTECAVHTLNEEESKHAVKVLRLTDGNSIHIINGQGYLFRCEIIQASAKACQLKVIEKEFQEPSKNHIHIALAPTKNIDRIEWLIEKAVEIGIQEISFIQTKNSERKQIKLDRLHKIMVSAMKQSKQLHATKLNDIVSFESFIENHPKGLIAHCLPTEKNTITDAFQSKSPIIIGPEGDFNPTEIDYALQHGYTPITLGESRLRTETAALYAVIEANLTLRT